MSEKQHEGISNRVVLRVDEDGCLQVPASLRQAAEIPEGGSVLVWLERGHLHVVSIEVAAREAQERFRPYQREGESLVDSLIADRRAEARREDGDD